MNWFCRMYETMQITLSNKRQKREFKLQKRALIHLYGKIREEITGCTLSDFLESNKDFTQIDENFIEVSYVNLNQRRIKKFLEQFPGSKISHHFYETWICISGCENREGRSPVLMEPLNQLKEIISYFNGQPNQDFCLLLNKYEDTFYNVASAIAEITETTNVDEDSQKWIREILETFINEFNSLKELYTAMDKLDKKVIHNSVKNRLKLELETVNKIKTDWNILTVNIQK